MNPEDMQGLSADEIALLSGDELDETGAPAMDAADKAAAGQTDDDPEGKPAAAAPSPAPAPAVDPDDDDDVAATPAAAPPAAPAAPAPAAEAPAPAATVEDEPPLQLVDLADPAKLEQAQAALEAKEAAAFKQLLDGEIEQEAFDKIKAEVRAGERNIIVQTTRIEMHEQQVKQQQAETVVALMKSAAAAKTIDYAADKKAQAQFDQALQLVAGDPDNAKKSFKWLTNEAHRTVLALRGISPVAAPTPAPPAPAPAPASRAVDMSKLPPTLSRVPPAADPSIAGDEFAHLGNLSGAALEKAVAGMTPDQQERWLN